MKPHLTLVRGGRPAAPTPARTNTARVRVRFGVSRSEAVLTARAGEMQPEIIRVHLALDHFSMREVRRAVRFLNKLLDAKQPAKPELVP